jgi:hypothetical protein
MDITVLGSLQTTAAGMQWGWLLEIITPAYSPQEAILIAMGMTAMGSLQTTTAEMQRGWLLDVLTPVY